VAQEGFEPVATHSPQQALASYHPRQGEGSHDRAVGSPVEGNMLIATLAFGCPAVGPVQVQGEARLIQEAESVGGNGGDLPAKSGAAFGGLRGVAFRGYPALFL
jgi:hypothetical protein